MSQFGLSPSELELIVATFARRPGVTAAILFGSRAKGTASPSSDIDLALEGTLHPLEVEAIRNELDELPMPYQIDVIALATIQSTSLREHIERVGVRIFERTTG